MAARLDLRGRVWQLAIASLAVLLGVAAGVDPRIAVAAAIGLGFVVLVMADLTIGLCLFAIIAFLDVLPHLGGSALSFTKIVGFLLAISWLAKVSSSEDSRNDFLAAHPTFSYVLVLFIGWAAVSLTWAEKPGVGTTPLLRYALNLILFLIVYTAVRTPRHLVWTLGAYVAGSAAAAGYGLLNPPTNVAYYDVTRVSGTIGDPNELAAVLVGGTVLAAALAVTLKRAPLARIGAAAASVLCAAGIFLSLSRGGLVAPGFDLRAARIFERLGDRTMELMSRALLVALCGVLAADFFISQEFSKQLWLLLGLGPAVLAIAASARRERLSPPGSSAVA